MADFGGDSSTHFNEAGELVQREKV